MGIRWSANADRCIATFVLLACAATAPAARGELAATAGIELGPWYCAGPFKQNPLGLHRDEFEVVFPPQSQVLAAGAGAIDLAVTWQVKLLPGMTDPVRRWVRHDEWADGYVNPLPVGPPPMKSETCYLYRTLRAKTATALSMRVDALDNIAAWLNGRSLGVAHNSQRDGASRFPASLVVQLPLEPGENRLLIKITSMHGVHGFAFALPPIIPSSDFVPGQGIRSLHRDLGLPGVCAGSSPTPSAGRGGAPSYYVRRKTWQETWIASRTEVVKAGLDPRSAKTAAVRQALWQYTQADFSDAASQQEIAWAYADNVWNGYWETGDLKALHQNYRAVVTKTLGLSSQHAAALPAPGGKAELMAIIQRYRSARLQAERLTRPAGFQFDVTPLPMFDPPLLAMQQALDRRLPTSAGKAYLDRLADLKARLSRSGEPSRFIREYWEKEASTLPLIALLQCPPFYINAIAPYTSGGAAPASICVFDPAHPDRPPRVVFHEPQTAIYDMNLSYDARTIFFSARRKGGPWHIFEIGVDGGNLKQITSGDSSNISPVLLPNGELMFVSTRAGNHVVCQQGEAGRLYVCNRDGSSVRCVSGNTLSDHTPQVMNDGRVMFTRWDYGVDKNVFCRQKIWTMHPDGTRAQLFFGNTIEDPNGFWQARAIPGRSELVCVLGPHHNYQAGMIGLVWNELGIEAPRGAGFRWVTRELPAIGDTTLPWGYRNPYPLNEHQFLVSWGGDGEEKNRLYLLDDRGNRHCLYEAPGRLGCWNPLALEPRTAPPVIPPQNENPSWAYRDPLEAEQRPDESVPGTPLLRDVYEGIGANVARGEIKAIQIIEQVPRGKANQGDAIFGHWTIVGRGTMFVRRLIGVVPVERDGSACFTAPAVRDVSFNALDAEGRVVRAMGSTTHVMPGEQVSCIGCHEHRGVAPPAGRSLVPLAAQRAPSVPQFPAWTHHGILDFCTVVQPVLDKYCVECHGGPTPKAALDLSGDKTHLFNMAYDTLLDRGLVHYIPSAGTGHTEDTAKARGSYVSRICRYLGADHAGKAVPLEDRQRIYAWIDANVPYYGTTRFYDARAMGARDRWYIHDRSQWFHKDFAPVFHRRCMDCHKRYVSPQTYNFNPGGDGRILVTSRVWNELALSQFQLGHGRISGTGQYGPDYRINLTHPVWSQMLTAPLAKAAGGLGLCEDKDGGPIFRSTTDPDYRAMLAALQEGKAALDAHPREDDVSAASR